MFVFFYRKPDKQGRQHCKNIGLKEGNKHLNQGYKEG